MDEPATLSAGTGIDPINGSLRWCLDINMISNNIILH